MLQKRVYSHVTCSIFVCDFFLIKIKLFLNQKKKNKKKASSDFCQQHSTSQIGDISRVTSDLRKGQQTSTAGFQLNFTRDEIREAFQAFLDLLLSWFSASLTASDAVDLHLCKSLVCLSTKFSFEISKVEYSEFVFSIELPFLRSTWWLHRRWQLSIARLSSSRASVTLTPSEP